ncbi:MAG: DUF4198 domain-containing protein [Planctomycetota bacterium]
MAFGTVLVALGALGHNSWVVADRTRLDGPGTVRLAFVTGHDAFPVGENATQPERIASWTVVRGETSTPVTGYAIEGRDLVAHAELTAPGLHIAAAALYPRFIEFDGDTFTRYLETERAKDALEQRRRDGSESRPGLEYYTKFGKAFVQVGPIDPSDTSHAEPVGHRLEIVPVTNPVGWTVGQTVRVRVLLEGRVAAHHPIASGHESSPAHRYEQELMTDGEGVAEFVIDKPGHWFIRTHTIGACDGLPAVALPPATGDGSFEPSHADWESYWASMTVGVAE